MASLLELGWQYLITNFSDFQLATFGTFIIHEAVFFSSGFLLMFLETSGRFSKYKIQEKTNTRAAQWRCIMKITLFHVLFNLPLTLLSISTFKYMGVRSSLPLPPWTVIISQVAFYFIWEDFVNYWLHRMLHTKWWYQNVHSIHHEFATPFGFATEYAHPVEVSIFGFGTVFGPALTGPHLFTYCFWMLLRLVAAIETHCGYDFPWNLSKFLPFYGGAAFHDIHHRLLYTRTGNYSSTFTYMDLLYGTHRDLREQKSQHSSVITDKSKEF